jgi:predicted ATPase with chaperone activity
MALVGLPDAAVKESKDRVSTALMNSADRVHFSGPVHELVLGHG